MTEIIAFDDPVARAIRFAARYWGDAVRPDEPDGPDYDPDELLIIISDGGGAGIQDVAFTNFRIVFDVRHTDQARASKVARALAGLFCQWQFIERDIYTASVSDTPTWNPIEDRRVHAYTWTYGFRLRGRPVELDPLT